MMNGHLAIVYKQLPEKHGVLVVFRDGSFNMDTLGGGPQIFARVLGRRAHNQWGSEVELPREGELGLVLDLEGGFSVWVGSMHWQDRNQVDPEERLNLSRADNGTLTRSRDNGDHEWLHPSGLRLTVSDSGEALPNAQRNGEGPVYAQATPAVQLEHPAFGSCTITPEGNLEIVVLDGTVLSYSQADGLLSADVAGSVEIAATDSVKVSSQGLVDVQAADVVRVQGVTSVEILSAGKVSVQSYGDCTVESSGTLALNAVGPCTITAWDAFTATANGPVNITSTTGIVTLNSGTAMNLNASGNVTITAPFVYLV